MNNIKQKTWFSRCKNTVKEVGLTDKDSDYNGMLGRFILDLCKTFNKQITKHSGESAEQTARIFLALVMNDGKLPK